MREYIEIPLDARKYMENLTTEQLGVIFKNIYKYFFKYEKLNSDDSTVAHATLKIISRIKEYAENGK